MQKFIVQISYVCLTDVFVSVAFIHLPLYN
jgi:hypothetical protein